MLVVVEVVVVEEVEVVVVLVVLVVVGMVGKFKPITSRVGTLYRETASLEEASTARWTMSSVRDSSIFVMSAVYPATELSTWSCVKASTWMLLHRRKLVSILVRNVVL